MIWTLGAWRSVELRNAFHMSMTATWRCRHRSGPYRRRTGPGPLRGAPQNVAHPDGALLVQIRNHDRVAVSLADRDFIDAMARNRFRGRCSAQSRRMNATSMRRT